VKYKTRIVARSTPLALPRRAQVVQLKATQCIPTVLDTVGNKHFGPHMYK
jgi:hypothetical protein